MNVALLLALCRLFFVVTLCVVCVFQSTAVSVMDISDHHMTDVVIIRPDVHIEVNVKSQR